MLTIDAAQRQAGQIAGMAGDGNWNATYMEALWDFGYMLVAWPKNALWRPHNTMDAPWPVSSEENKWHIPSVIMQRSPDTSIGVHNAAIEKAAQAVEDTWAGCGVLTAAIRALKK
jgi:hypothetical protein